jgi:hypothetical protein
MATHPYISGAGNITQMIGFLRKNFPASVTSETVRKLGVASKNESYVINALQFLGLIDEEGKRTERGRDVMTIHNEADFQKAFQSVVRDAYADLFEIRADDAWTMGRDQLISYFRNADKTSEVIGTRQAGVFLALRGLAGHANESSADSSKSKVPPVKRAAVKKTKPPAQSQAPKVNADGLSPAVKTKGEMALTVRIEINLPAEGTQATYDAIFKSIKANLFP